VQDTGWWRGLEMVADDVRLVAHAGAVPVRLLAEQTGLACGLSAAMRRRGFHPLYDRGQILVDLAVTLILGGEAISDFRALDHLEGVIGPVPSVPTVWRALAEAGDLQLRRVSAAMAEFRRHWRGLLEARPGGFPWLTVAGKELTGVTVVDLDASVVFAASDKQNAAPAYKGGTGFCPNLATCDNVGDLLGIDPRPGNATANCAVGNIRLLDLAVAALPGRYRHRMLVRVDGAGATHDLVAYIRTAGGRRGRRWEFSAGWACTGREMNAIELVPARAWQPGIDQHGEVVQDTFVAELTGLLDLAEAGWPEGTRIIVRQEPLHPRYRKRASDREKQLGIRYQLIATDSAKGQIAWLDARHRSHAHAEDGVKLAKALGLARWPSRSWAINVAWTQVVAIAFSLLACFRLLALPEGELRAAEPKLLRFRLLNLPARLTRGQRRRWLHLRADWPWADDLTACWQAIRAPPAPT
jgi:Transposase DDE domain group 1